MAELVTSPRMSELRAWVLAARLRTLSAGAAPVLVGTGLAVADGVFALLPAVAALAAALLIQVGTNLANDYFDHVKGADTAERVGPTRVTQAGLLAPGRVRAAMVATFALAVLLGAYLVWVGGLPIVGIGLASVAAGVLYTGGPWPLGYHGLGDLFVLVFFGFVAVAGAYYVQALAFTLHTLVAGAGIGALSTAILVVNNLRDRETDAKAGKRTLAVRLGRTGSRVEYVALLAVGLAAPIVGVLWFGWPVWSLAALVAFALAGPPLHRVLTFRDPRSLNPALVGTARLVGLYGVLLTLGLIVP